MKKLMTMLATVATTLGLFAALPSATSFEGSSEFDQDGKLVQGADWSCEDGAAALTKGTYVGDAYDKWDTTKENNRYQVFVDDDDKQAAYLKVKTAFDKPLLRAIGETVADDSIFFDQLVKFTAADEAMTLSSKDDKIALYVLDRSELDDGDPLKAAATNLYAIAGQFVDGVLADETRTYDLGAINVDEWYRVTIKTTLAWDGTDLGFQVFIDGTARAYTGVSAYDSVAAEALSANAYALNISRKILPSAVQGDATVASVGFAGQGAIDDVIATTEVPGKWGEDKNVVLRWDDDSHLTALKYSVSGGAQKTADLTTNEVQIAWIPDMTITIAPTFAKVGNTQYAFNGFEKIAGSYLATDLVLSSLSDDAEMKILAKDGTPRLALTIDGVSAGTAATFAEALAKINKLLDGQSAKIVLAENMTIEATDLIMSDADVEIDLAGKTITGTIQSSAALTISDSSEEATGKVQPATDADAVKSTGVLTVTGGTFEGPVNIEAGSSLVSGGKFLKGAEEEFQLTCEEGYTAELDATETYWTIVEEEYTIYYMIDETTPFKQDTFTKATAATKVLDAGDREGYKFIRWEDEDFNPVTSLAGKTEDVTLYGVWTPINYVAQIGEKKFETVAEAFAAAEDGNVINIIGDSLNETVAAKITGTGKADLNVIVSNDAYTVCWPTNTPTDSYAIMINGATVTFGGNGIWKKESGSASLIQAGATAEADVIIDAGNFVVGKYDERVQLDKEAPSNLIASKWGNITVNGGSFVNYRWTEGRCVRAEGTSKDASKGIDDDRLAKAIINGGTLEVTIDNPTESSAVANQFIAVDNKGQAQGSVEINGGKFKSKHYDRMSAWCGTGFKLKKESDSDWYVRTAIDYATLTITPVDHCTIAVTTNDAPVESGATFDKDDAVQIKVTRTPDQGYKLADGYLAEETITMDDNREVTAVVEPEQTDEPLPPEGGSKEVDLPSTADPADVIAASGVTVGVAPVVATALEENSISAETYKSYFAPKATFNATTKKWDVTVDFKSDVQSEIQTAVDNAAANIVEAIGDATATQATVVTKPGLYYGLVSKGAVEGINTAKPDTWTMATSTSMTFDLNKTAQAQFFKVVCSPVGGTVNE